MPAPTTTPSTSGWASTSSRCATELSTPARSAPAPGPAAAIVIGDSFTQQPASYALDDLRAALSDDLVAEAWASQHRPMLGGRELRAFGDRPKAEHIVLLR